MSKLVIEEVDTNHLINRIAWCKRQKIDTWAVHGDEPKYGAGGYMDSVINDYNDKIDTHIEKLEAELEQRNTPPVPPISADKKDIKENDNDN